MNAALLLAKAKEYINDFCQMEYDTDADFSDLKRINVAYTPTEDERFAVQSYIDLINYRIFTTVGNDIIRVEKYATLEEIVEDLKFLNFDDLTDYEDPDDTDFELIEIFGQPALFSNSRIYDYFVPEGMKKYDIRHDDNGDFASVEERVFCNHAGSIIVRHPIDLGPAKMLLLYDSNAPNFSGEQMTISEYAEKYTND